MDPEHWLVAIVLKFNQLCSGGGEGSGGERGRWAEDTAGYEMGWAAPTPCLRGSGPPLPSLLTGGPPPVHKVRYLPYMSGPPCGLIKNIRWWDERHLLPVYEGQALPSAPYSLADLLQYIRWYICSVCQALPTTCSWETFSSTYEYDDIYVRPSLPQYIISTVYSNQMYPMMEFLCMWCCNLPGEKCSG